MNRQQKQGVIADVKKLFTESQATFLVHYKGLSVASMQQLRKGLRQQGGELKVTKATLMKIATKDVAGIDGFSDQLKDQVGLVFAKNDVPSIAKNIVTFSKDHEALKVLAGFFEARALSKAEVNFLASLPSKEELLAHVVGTVQAPLSGLVGVLHTMLAQVVYVLNQAAEKNK